MGLNIVDIRATPVSVPTKKAYPTSWLRWTPPGTQPATVVLVEVLTDEDIVGVGEALVTISAEVTKQYVELAKPLLIGEDSFEVNVIRKNLYAHFKGVHIRDTTTGALASIEMALWDAIGKSLKKPLYKLWGGAFRTEVPFWGYVARAKPEEMSAEAELLAREGAKTLFTKVGFDPASDEEAVKAIRNGANEAKADVPIRIDANQSWTPGAAIRNIRRLEKYGLEYVEQPVSMYNLEAMARVRRAVDAPILAHESCWTFYDTLNVIKRDAADAIQIDPRFDVGFAGARNAAGIAEAAGMPVAIHAWNDLGISTCATIHLAASGPNFTLPNQTEYRNRVDDVLNRMLHFEKGSIRVPEDPGLGFELDYEKVRKYHEYYVTSVKGKESTKELSPFGSRRDCSVNIAGAQP